MSKNLVYAGQSPAISLPVPAGTRSGGPVKVGGIVGVAETDRVETVNGVKFGEGSGNPEGYASVAPDGTYALPVPDAVAAVGTAIYIAADNTLTTTATNNTLFGHTVPTVLRGVASGATKGSGAGTVNVRIVRV